eukprot:COSAG02_NODE_5873_length_3972_cov_20.899045_5_plen_81_part_00
MMELVDGMSQKGICNSDGRFINIVCAPCVRLRIHFGHTLPFQIRVAFYLVLRKPLCSPHNFDTKGQGCLVFRHARSLVLM